MTATSNVELKGYKTFYESYKKTVNNLVKADKKSDDYKIYEYRNGTVHRLVIQNGFLENLAVEMKAKIGQERSKARKVVDSILSRFGFKTSVDKKVQKLMLVFCKNFFNEREALIEDLYNKKILNAKEVLKKHIESNMKTPLSFSDKLEYCMTLQKEQGIFLTLDEICRLIEAYDTGESDVTGGVLECEKELNKTKSDIQKIHNWTYFQKFLGGVIDIHKRHDQMNIDQEKVFEVSDNEVQYWIDSFAKFVKENSSKEDDLIRSQPKQAFRKSLEKKYDGLVSQKNTLQNDILLYKKEKKGKEDQLKKYRKNKSFPAHLPEYHLVEEIKGLSLKIAAKERDMKEIRKEIKNFKDFPEWFHQYHVLLYSMGQQTALT